MSYLWHQLLVVALLSGGDGGRAPAKEVALRLEALVGGAVAASFETT